MSKPVLKYKSDNLTVFAIDKKEAIVYGDGADWIAQFASSTSGGKPFRSWFAHRGAAEDHAKGLLTFGE